MNCLLSTAYWPNLHYFFYILNSESVSIECHDHYGKQSFRNRTRILSANGVLDLSIPILKKAKKELVKDIGISYRENWQLKHWRAITSAYKNSPYFEFFEEEIKSFYSGEYETLLHYNLEQLRTVLKILKQEKTISLTTSFAMSTRGAADLRESIHPKIDFMEDRRANQILTRPYYQTFENKFEFCPNLSILDLLFNEGLGAKEYLDVRE